MSGFLNAIDFVYSFSHVKNGLQIVWAQSGQNISILIHLHFMFPLDKHKKAKERWHSLYALSQFILIIEILQEREILCAMWGNM